MKIPPFNDLGWKGGGGRERRTVSSQDGGNDLEREEGEGRGRGGEKGGERRVESSADRQNDLDPMKGKRGGERRDSFGRLKGREGRTTSSSPGRNLTEESSELQGGGWKEGYSKGRKLTVESSELQGRGWKEGYSKEILVTNRIPLKLPKKLSEDGCEKPPVIARKSSPVTNKSVDTEYRKSSPAANKTPNTQHRKLSDELDSILDGRVDINPVEILRELGVGREDQSVDSKLGVGPICSCSKVGRKKTSSLSQRDQGTSPVVDIVDSSHRHPLRAVDGNPTVTSGGLTRSIGTVTELPGTQEKGVQVGGRSVGVSADFCDVTALETKARSARGVTTLETEAQSARVVTTLEGQLARGVTTVGTFPHTAAAQEEPEVYLQNYDALFKFLASAQKHILPMKTNNIGHKERRLHCTADELLLEGEGYCEKGERLESTGELALSLAFYTNAASKFKQVSQLYGLPSDHVIRAQVRRESCLKRARAMYRKLLVASAQKPQNTSPPSSTTGGATQYTSQRRSHQVKTEKRQCVSCLKMCFWLKDGRCSNCDLRASEVAQQRARRTVPRDFTRPRHDQNGYRVSAPPRRLQYARVDHSESSSEEEFAPPKSCAICHVNRGVGGGTSYHGNSSRRRRCC